MIFGGVSRQPWWVYAGLVVCGLFRLVPKTMTPLPPPPSAVTAKGHADDPTEAIVVGGLDLKLRDLLQQPQKSG